MKLKITLTDADGIWESIEDSLGISFHDFPDKFPELYELYESIIDGNESIIVELDTTTWEANILEVT